MQTHKIFPLPPPQNYLENEEEAGKKDEGDEGGEEEKSGREGDATHGFFFAFF